MPSLSQITNNFFVSLINRLGVRPPPPESFVLSNVVQPVSIVDSDISIPAVLTTQRLDAPFSAGVLVAPVANTLMADTGALPAGDYQLLIWVGIGNVAGSGDFFIQRRDAANAANIWQQLCFMNTNGPGYQLTPLVVTLAANERIRVFTRLNWSATGHASIWVSPLT